MKHLLSLGLIAIAASAHAQTVTLDQAKAQAGSVTPGDRGGVMVPGATQHAPLLPH